MQTIKRGEIYYADLSPTIGCEQDGIRPVIIIQNDTGNYFSPTTIVAAITSRKTKAKLPTHVEITTNGLKKKSTVLLEQLRTLDKLRLIEYVGEAETEEMEKINKALATSLGIEYKGELK